VSRVENRAAEGGGTAEGAFCWRTRCGLVRGLPANNAMLWGARGNGKSSLVKSRARGGECSAGGKPGADRDPPRGYSVSARAAEPAARAGRGAAMILCDDLSFEKEDADYKGAEIGAGWRDRGKGRTTC